MSNTTKVILTIIGLVIGLFVVIKIVGIVVGTLIMLLPPIIVIGGLGYLGYWYVTKKAIGRSDRRSLP